MIYEAGCEHNCKECEYDCGHTPKDCVKLWVTIIMFELGCILFGIMYSPLLGVPAWVGLLIGGIPLWFMLLAIILLR